MHIVGNHMSWPNYGPRREKICLQRFANNEGADQPARPRSLISPFVICFLERTISKLCTSKISIFTLVSVAEETGLNIALSETPKTGFVATKPILLKARVDYKGKISHLSL